MIVLTITLTILLLYAIYKWFLYYCGFLGVLYYLKNSYEDISDKKTKELRDWAIEQTIQEFFDKK